MLFLQPASSTYADCEENDSPSSEYAHDVTDSVVKTDAVDVAPAVNDKVNEGSHEVKSGEPIVNDNDFSTKENIHDGPDCDKIDVAETANDGNGIIEENINGDYEDELDQNDDYDNEDCRKSISQNDAGSSAGSDFDSEEQENDRENGDGQEVTDVRIIFFRCRYFVVLQN